MSSENHVLSLLIQLRDQASAGLQKFTKNLEHSHQAAYRNASALGSLSTIGYRTIETGRMIGDSWHRQTESLRKYTDAALELVRAQSKFQAINLSPEENTKAFAAVEQTVRNLRGLSLAETTETLTDLHTAFGKLDEAILALPVASKYRFSFESLFSDKFSKEEIEQQIQSGFKFLEMVRAIKASGGLDAAGSRVFLPQDQTRMEEYFSRVSQITAATGGRVSPTDLLQMAKTGGTALQGLSVEGLTNLTGTAQELGGNRTGTALQTLFQQVIAGRIQQKGLMEWQRLGLLDTKQIEVNKSGIVKKMNAGAIPIGDYLQEDPLKFADALRDAMQKHGVNTSDPKAVIKELGALKMPRNAMEITSLFINQRDRMIKEADLVKHAKNTEQLNKEAEDSPMGRIKKFESMVTDLRAKIGLPLITVGTEWAQKLMPILDWLANHPNLALGLITAGKALAFISETSFYLRASGLLGTLNGIEQGGMAAGRGMGVAEQRAIGLRKASGTFGFIIKTAVYGVAIEKILEFLSAMREANEASENLKTMSKQFATSLGKDIADSRTQIEELKKLGKPIPEYLSESLSPKRLLEQAGNTFAALDFSDSPGKAMLARLHMAYFNRGGKIEDYLRGAFAENINPQNWYANENTARRLLRERAPELKEPPEMMAAFRAKLLTLPNVTPEMSGRANVLLQKEYPESYSKSNQMMAEYAGQLLIQMATQQRTSSSLEQLGNSAKPLPSIFNRMAFAVNLNSMRWHCSLSG